MSSSAETVVCPGCSASYKLPPSAAGKRVRCPKCGAAIPGGSTPPPVPVRTITPAPPPDPDEDDRPDEGADEAGPTDDRPRRSRPGPPPELAALCLALAVMTLTAFVAPFALGTPYIVYHCALALFVPVAVGVFAYAWLLAARFRFTSLLIVSMVASAVPAVLVVVGMVVAQHVEKEREKQRPNRSNDLPKQLDWLR